MQWIVTEMIQKRYASESCCDSSLSCGNNIGILDLKPGEVVLDLGCGAGHETLEAAKIVGKTGAAIGLDITAEMLKVAQKQAQNSHVTNVSFLVGSIEELPFPDGSFNAVTSNCVINHALDKNQVYREIYRVLKDDGRFVVSDAVSLQPLPESITTDPEQWAACFGGAITEDEYLRSIKAAGFSKIIIVSRREYLKNGYEFASLTIKAEKISNQHLKGGEKYETGNQEK